MNWKKEVLLCRSGVWVGRPVTDSDAGTPDRPQLGRWPLRRARVVAAAEPCQLNWSVRHAVRPATPPPSPARRSDGSSYCWPAAGCCREERSLPRGWVGVGAEGTAVGDCRRAEQTCSARPLSDRRTAVTWHALKKGFDKNRSLPLHKDKTSAVSVNWRTKQRTYCYAITVGSES